VPTIAARVTRVDEEVDGRIVRFGGLGSILMMPSVLIFLKFEASIPAIVEGACRHEASTLSLVLSIQPPYWLRDTMRRFQFLGVRQKGVSAPDEDRR
jgi:hypothetical protein